MIDYSYIYRFRNNAKRKLLYGKRCRVIKRLAKNSAVVEFEDGHKEIISRNALRRKNDKARSNKDVVIPEAK